MSKRDFSAARVVVCDDSITNVMVLSNMLGGEGVRNVHGFTDPRKVLPFVRERDGDIDLLILDIEMPYLSGFDIMNALRAEFGDVPKFPVLVITGLDDRQVRYRALQEGAGDFLNKPFDECEVALRVGNLLRFQCAMKAQTRVARQLEGDVEQRTRELNKANDLLVRLLALAGEMRDGDTGNHVARVGRYSRILAEGIGLSQDVCFMIEKAAPLHDVGKIGIPDRILLKKSRLDAAELGVMRSHTTKGLQLLGEFGHDSLLIQMAASIAYNHHEKWDGSGYPRGMRSESIPIEGRIVAISDVFDALTSVRPYKQAWSMAQAIAYLRENAGTHFDPTLVAVFVDNIARVTHALQELRDTCQMAVGSPAMSQPPVVAS